MELDVFLKKPLEQISNVHMEKDSDIVRRESEQQSFAPENLKKGTQYMNF